LNGLIWGGVIAFVSLHGLRAQLFGFHRGARLCRALGHVPGGRRGRRGGEALIRPAQAGRIERFGRSRAALRPAPDRLCAGCWWERGSWKVRFAQSALCAVGTQRDRRELLAVHVALLVGWLFCRAHAGQCR